MKRRSSLGSMAWRSSPIMYTRFSSLIIGKYSERTCSSSAWVILSKKAYLLTSFSTSNGFSVFGVYCASSIFSLTRFMVELIYTCYISLIFLSISSSSSFTGSIWSPNSSLISFTGDSASVYCSAISFSAISSSWGSAVLISSTSRMIAPLTYSSRSVASVRMLGRSPYDIFDFFILFRRFSSSSGFSVTSSRSFDEFCAPPSWVFSVLLLLKLESISSSAGPSMDSFLVSSVSLKSCSFVNNSSSWI